MLLLQHDWPGNIRELRHTIEHAVISAENKKISEEVLQCSIPQKNRFNRKDIESYNGISLRLPDSGATLDDISNCAIRVTLKLVKGNKRKAARILGISPPRLYRKLEQIESSTNLIGTA